MGKPIYDQPDHPHYGPVRRLHLILMLICGDRMQRVEEDFEAYFRTDWTHAMVERLEEGRPENVTHRDMLRWILGLVA